VQALNVNKLFIACVNVSLANLATLASLASLASLTSFFKIWYLHNCEFGKFFASVMQALEVF
jgi:hypothetical protein